MFSPALGQLPGKHKRPLGSGLQCPAVQSSSNGLLKQRKRGAGMRKEARSREKELRLEIARKEVKSSHTLLFWVKREEKEADQGTWNIHSGGDNLKPWGVAAAQLALITSQTLTDDASSQALVSPFSAICIQCVSAHAHTLLTTTLY